MLPVPQSTGKLPVVAVSANELLSLLCLAHRVDVANADSKDNVLVPMGTCILSPFCTIPLSMGLGDIKFKRRVILGATV